MGKQQKAPAKKKQPSPSPARKGLVLWICLLFFVSAWMFVLGIFVGRGTAPVKFDIEKLQRELAALKETMIKKELRRYNIGSNTDQNKTKMEFYETLKGSKGEAKLKAELPVKKTAPTPEKIASKPIQTDRSKKIEAVKKQTISDLNKNRDDQKPFTIQVASLKDPSLADKMVETLIKKGYPAYRSIGKIPGRGIWFRVRVGAFKNKAAAAGTFNRLKKDKFDGIVVQR
jgi:cell division protein FtsN